MKGPDKPERIYVGVRALRNSMARYVAKAGEGALVIVRDRNKKILAVMTSEGIACADGVERLPPEIYAAYFLHREALAQLSSILHRVSPLVVQEIVQAAVAIEAAARPAPRKQKPEPPNSEPQPEPTELREERIRAQARARTRAAAEKREKEKLAETMLREVTPVNVEALSIRHSIKE